MPYGENLVLVTAEHLPQDQVAAEMRRYTARRKPAGVFYSAWNHVEYALNDKEDMDDLARGYYFESAQELLGEVISSPDTHHDMRFAALRLSSYIPVFAKRRNSESLTSEDCQELYRSIGAALAYLKPLTIDEPPQSVMLEAGCEALSARSLQVQHLLYPTSPREESSPYSKLNHDSYFYDRGKKIPLQQKTIPTSKHYDESVRMLTLMPLLKRNAHKAGIELPGSDSERLNYLLGLIIAETSGNEIERSEKQLLDRMTRSIISHKFLPILDRAA